MSTRRSCDVSVVLPFNDDEDVVGTAVKRVAAQLRELEASFEIIAVDEDSGDNSHAVLALLRRECPELRIVHVGARGRGYDCGVQRAMGRVLWLIEPAQAVEPLAPFGRAYRRVDRGERDLVIVTGRFVVAGGRAREVLAGVKGLGAAFQRRVLKGAARSRLNVESQVVGGAGPRVAAPRPLARLIGALAPSWPSRPARTALANRDR